jgi:hypothetical protein
MRKNCVAAGVWLGVVVGMMAPGAWGQIVPPAPPKTPPTPEYTPPPPPPPPVPVVPRDGAAPEAKPAPEAPLPSLVERDAQGRVKPLGMPTEEAAVRALKPSEETMKKVEASLAGRGQDLDRLVVEHVEALAELRAFTKKITEDASLEEISVVAKKAVPFKNFVGVLDRLQREGAIDPQMKSRAQRVAQEYQKAVDDDAFKNFEHNKSQAMVLVGFQRYMRITTTEAYASLDRQLLGAAPKAAELLNTISVAPERKTPALSRVRDLPAGESASARQQRLEVMQRVFFDVLGPEERQAFLRAANPALAPAAPAAPADQTK